ncbi:hypothetical protein [uncultured Rummeliibacillus sp.]|uniref:hypothetical protein n=1 Tax=uncultured Rummeliibacillus sp. TaxID=762292 RepID=UPI0026254011|nr:hypothetical protein [uncultured Rummeliibacillus sp.]
MSHYKIAKTATALIVGASVLTSSVVGSGADAFAKITYKITKKGTLVNATTNQTIKGYKSYNGILYKNGKAFTGIYKKKYYKAGVKKTGTYKGAYYVKGVYKVTTGTYAGAYYVNGVKKVKTGTYAGAYYVNGIKKVETGTFENAYYVKGKKVVETGLYKGQLYKDGVLNVGLALFNDKYYFNATLANDTYLDNGVEKAFENGQVVAPKVKSVESLNAKQIKVTFNRSVDASTIIGEDSALKNISITKVGSVASTGLTAQLSEDKRSLIITAESGSIFSGSYVAEVSNQVKTTTNEKFTADSQIIKADDKVAPTYVNFTKENATTFAFNFSEPINDKGFVALKYADGTSIQVPSDNITVEGSSIKVILPSTVSTGKDIVVSFTGLTDFGANILETPFSVSIQKGEKDGVAPVVTSITPINAKKFEIKFSEEVQEFDKTDLNLAGSNSSIKSVTKDKNDKTQYIVELNSAVSGLVTITIPDKSYSDLSGEVGKAFSQVLNFVADTVKPTVTLTVSMDKNDKQVLTLTTSEETSLIASGTITLPAKAVKNYVTTTGNIKFAASDLTPVSGSSTQYTIPLSKVKFEDKALEKDTTYTLDLVENIFADVANNKNDAKKSAFTFTRGEDKDNSKPSLTDNQVKVIDNDTFTVDFGTERALDNSTIVNKNNYFVAGATIDSVTLNANGVATVKLVSGSNNYTGNRTVKIKGIKALNGNTMDDFSTIKLFNENVKPTLISAKITKTTPAIPDSANLANPGSTTVVLIFNESVKVTNDTTYKVNIGGIEVIGTVASVSKTAYSNKEVTVTINKELTITDFGKGITLSSNDYQIVDEANNKADIGANGIVVNL